VLGKRFALKALHPELRDNEVAEARFEREGRLTASLAHPSVIEIVDFARDEGLPYLVMELVRGGTLADRIANDGAMPLTAVLDVLLPVISAIAHAHERRVVHRDLKPANVLLGVGPYGDAVPKVTDFGIGKHPSLSDERLTIAGALLGTLPYMAPEQVREARSVGPRADQYALGVMLYEASTGARPYGGETTLARMNAILAGGAPPPSARVSTLPAAFDAIVLKALAVQPEDSFASVAELGDALLVCASKRTWSIWSTAFAAEMRADAAASEGTGDDALRDGRDGVGYSIPLTFAGEPTPRRRGTWGERALALAVGAAAASGIVALREPPQGPSWRSLHVKEVAGACEMALHDVAPAEPAPAPVQAPPGTAAGHRATTVTRTREERVFSENHAPILE